MPLLLLLRHGENEYVKEGKLAGRLAGVHLNETGRAQAARLAEIFKEAPITAVYSSPLDRTLETAQPIAAALGQAVIPCEGLLELDFGDWQNQEIKTLKEDELWQIVQRAPSHMRFPRGESFAEAQLRAVNQIERLCAGHEPEAVLLCVAHSDLIKLVVAYYLGLPLDLFQRLMVSPASVTTLHIGPQGAFLINLNHAAVLEIPQPPKKAGQTPPSAPPGKTVPEQDDRKAKNGDSA